MGFTKKKYKQNFPDFRKILLFPAFFGFLFDIWGFRHFVHHLQKKNASDQRPGGSLDMEGGVTATACAPLCWVAIPRMGTGTEVATGEVIPGRAGCSGTVMRVAGSGIAPVRCLEFAPFIVLRALRTTRRTGTPPFILMGLAVGAGPETTSTPPGLL